MTTLLVGWAVAAVATLLLVRLAPRLHLLDMPNARSLHASPVPRGGGIAILLATVLAVAAGDEWSDMLVGLVVGASVLGITGLVDDRIGLPAIPRLAVQFAVPLVVVVMVIDRSTVAAAVGATIAVVFVAGFVNAFNFMDGINGISALHVFVAATFLAALGDHVDRPDVVIAGLAACGAAAGFLPFNIVRARIFLGDVGSYFLGAWLAGLALMVLDAGTSVVVVAAPFLVYGADTSTVLVRRARRGERLTEAHRDHTYQRLVQGGWKHLTVAALCALTSAVCCGLMYAVVDAGSVTQVVGFTGCLALVAGYLALPAVQRNRSHSRGTS